MISKKSTNTLLVGSLAVMIFVTAILLVSFSRQKSEKEHLQSLVRQLEQQIPSSVDSLDAQAYVAKIEARLYQIDEYLAERGVKGFSQDAVGGHEQRAPRLSPIEYYSMYDQYLERLYAGLLYTPTGLPAHAEMSSSFGYRRNPFGGRSLEFHSGVDFRGNRGDDIRSTAQGKVVHAGYDRGYGNYLIVKHANGFETLYGHLSETKVRTGDRVAANQVIGKMGSTGRSTGNHLHYEVRKDGKPVDPAQFIKIF